MYKVKKGAKQIGENVPVIGKQKDIDGHKQSIKQRGVNVIKRMDTCKREEKSPTP